MRRILFVLVSIILSIVLSACGKDNEQMCFACNEVCSESASFCSNCGATLFLASPKEEQEYEEEIVDYSDFGFENNYGMTEWIVIDYDNSDFSSDEPYVETRSKVLNFANGYIECRIFNEKTTYKGVCEEGNLKGLYSYVLASNRLLSLSDTVIYQIKDVSIENNIPIIQVVLRTEKTYEHRDYELPSSEYLIPSNFIDFDYEPQRIERVNNDNGLRYTNTRYRIKKEM